MTSQQAREGPKSDASGAGDRAFRGLFLIFVLTFLNLAGITLTVVGLNALGDWTIWQFIGFFGAVEVGSGIANVVTPNLWAMPVVEQETSSRTRSVLALKTLTLPHWGGLARTVAGIVMIAVAGWQSGFGPTSLLLLPFCLAIAWLQIALSALLARGGVAFHDYDVLQITLNWRREVKLPPISLSASALQFILSLITIPAITILAPSVLYQPEIGPAPDTLLILTAFTAVITLLALASWYPRIALHAPREQQQEAEARS